MHDTGVLGVKMAICPILRKIWYNNITHSIFITKASWSWCTDKVN